MHMYSTLQSRPSLHGQHALLVHANSADTPYYKNMLSDMGYHITHAPNLIGAFNAIDQQHFNMVLFDVTLPDGSGIELLKALRFDRKFINSTLVAMTHIKDANLRRQYLEKGIDAYFEKPLCSQKLARRLQLLSN